jgi:RNA polymerase sigma factor (sigma-70 family)
MLVSYELTDNKIIQVEVSESVAIALADFKREDDNYRRKMRRHNELSLDAMKDDTEFEPADFAADLEQNYIEQEERDELTAAVAKLPKADYDLIQAVYYDDITPQDYAVQKGISFQAVYKRLVKIFAKLKNILS